MWCGLGTSRKSSWQNEGFTHSRAPASVASARIHGRFSSPPRIVSTGFTSRETPFKETLFSKKRKLSPTTPSFTTPCLLQAELESWLQIHVPFFLSH